MASPPDDKKLPEELMPASQPPTFKDIEITPELHAYALDRWPDVSDSMRAFRVRQTIWTRFMAMLPHPDDPSRRKVGGAQPGSGGRTKRIGTTLMEAVRERQDEIVNAAFSAIDDKNDPGLRHKAAMNLAKLEREERMLEMAEDEHARKSAEELQREAAAMIAEMVRKGDVNLNDIIQGSATEVSTSDADVVPEPEPESRQIAS